MATSAGKLHQIDTLTVEVRLQDFHPRHDLRGLFLNALATDGELRNRAPRLRR